LQPGEIPNIADRNVVITVLPNMTSKTVIDFYHPITPIPHSDTVPLLPHILILASTWGPCTPQPASLLGHAPSPSHFRLAQAIFEPNLFPYKHPDNLIPFILPTYTAMKMEESVPKRQNIKFRSLGTTKKKEYNIQNTAKV
jgi:hypothetical protein